MRNNGRSLSGTERNYKDGNVAVIVTESVTRMVIVLRGADEGWPGGEGWRVVKWSNGAVKLIATTEVLVECRSVGAEHSSWKVERLDPGYIAESVFSLVVIGRHFQPCDHHRDIYKVTEQSSRVPCPKLPTNLQGVSLLCSVYEVDRCAIL